MNLALVVYVGFVAGVIGLVVWRVALAQSRSNDEGVEARRHPEHDYT